MPRESAPQLLDRVHALPGAQPLLAALAADAVQPVFLVGGAVRDLLLGGDPLDLDVAVEGPLEPLTERLGGVTQTHERFTTASLERAGTRYDIAQTRAESYAAPGALPEVRPASVEDDLRRRDFTVNAIALGIAGPLAGELLSVPGALADLDARRLAVLHDQSFSDDPTRLLRLVRYQARLGFEIEPGSRALARATLAAGALATVSGARIGSELRLLTREPDPVAAFSALHELGADVAIDPLLRFDADRARIATAALVTLPSADVRLRRDLLPPAVALLDAPRDHVSRLLDSLEFTAADRDAIVEAATTARLLAHRAQTARTGSEIAHAVGTAGVETVAVASALLPPDQPQGRPNLQRWLEDLRHRTLQITGDDLIAAGLREGPIIGRALASVRDAMMDDQAPDRETQLRLALAAAR